MSTVNGWRTMPLGELLVTKNNKAKQIKSSEYSVVGLYPVVDQSSDFICGYHDDKEKLIDSDLPLTIFGDHTRHTKFVDFPFIAGADGTQLLKPKQGIENKFFYYLVKLVAQKIGNFGYDRHFKHLKEYVCEYPFQKDEQTKIAEILSTVDRTIEQTEALIAKQQRIKTGLMQDLLTRGIDEHGNLRSEQTHKFKDSPLGRIPVEWKVSKLCELVDEDITYGIVQAGLNIENGIPYIRTGDMTGETIGIDGLLRTSERIAESYKRSTIFAGDIVFALRASVGKVLPVSKELEGANLTQGTAKISPKETMDSSFLLWALRTDIIQNQICLHQKGTTFMEITLGDLRSIEIAFPMNRDEQLLISENLNKHDEVRLKLIQNCQKLHSLKTALMQDLLTGKKRVTALQEEV